MLNANAKRFWFQRSLVLCYIINLTLLLFVKMSSTWQVTGRTSWSSYIQHII